MISMMLIVLLATRSHVHTFNITNILLIYFWIKLVLKLPNFLTVEVKHTVMVETTVEHIVITNILL